MKTYSIGRDLNCDIVINDSTDIISRRHALLNVTSSGKMTLIDQSSNGTYVNGIRISPNVPVPVTRKDIISLAHVAKLDWNQVPRSNQWMKYCIWIIIAIGVIIGIIFGIKALNKKESIDITPTQGTELIDSTMLKQKEAARLDSIKKVERQDSIQKAAVKAREDSVKSATKTTPKKKEQTKPKSDTKSKGNEGKNKTKSGQNNKRTIG